MRRLRLTPIASRRCFERQCRNPCAFIGIALILMLSLDRLFPTWQRQRVIADDTTKFPRRSGAGDIDEPTLFQNGTGVSPTKHPARTDNSNKCHKITSLRIARAQLPWNHILTQNPQGGGGQDLDSFLLWADKTHAKALLECFRMFFANLGARNTEHTS